MPEKVCGCDPGLIWRPSVLLLHSLSLSLHSLWRVVGISPLPSASSHPPPTLTGCQFQLFCQRCFVSVGWMEDDIHTCIYNYIHIHIGDEFTCCSMYKWTNCVGTRCNFCSSIPVKHCLVHTEKRVALICNVVYLQHITVKCCIVIHNYWKWFGLFNQRYVFKELCLDLLPVVLPVVPTVGVATSTAGRSVRKKGCAFI